MMKSRAGGAGAVIAAAAMLGACTVSQSQPVPTAEPSSYEVRSSDVERLKRMIEKAEKQVKRTEGRCRELDRVGHVNARLCWEQTINDKQRIVDDQQMLNYYEDESNFSPY